MVKLNHDEQHEIRNAIQCLKGLVVKLRKIKRLTDQDKMLFYVHLKKICDVIEK